MLLYMSSTDETRREILEAASKRFFHYGYAKTTMAEIAGDCSMSAANLYRFFENKDEIVASIAGQYFERAVALLEVLVSRPGPAAERLEAVMLELLRFNHAEFEGRPRSVEQIEYVVRERQDMVDAWRDSLRGLIARIIERGVGRGEFETEDIGRAADAVMKATVVFHAPPVFLLLYMSGRYTMEQLEALARDIVGLLVRGLARR